MQNTRVIGRPSALLAAPGASCGVVTQRGVISNGSWWLQVFSAGEARAAGVAGRKSTLAAVFLDRLRSFAANSPETRADIASVVPDHGARGEASAGFVLDRDERTPGSEPLGEGGNWLIAGGKKLKGGGGDGGRRACPRPARR